MADSSTNPLFSKSRDPQSGDYFEKPRRYRDNWTAILMVLNGNDESAVFSAKAPRKTRFRVRRFARSFFMDSRHLMIDESLHRFCHNTVEP